MEEVDATTLDEATDSQASQASTTSASSLAIQFSAEDLQENDAELPPPASTESLRKEGKVRRLNRRLALANLQLPKLSAKENCVIDLCNDEERAEDLMWFKKKFPSVETGKVNAESDVVLKKDMSPSKSYLPPSIASQRALKKDLEKKLAKRRRIELEKRKELYMEDNEGLVEDEDEEEEALGTKISRTKKHVKKLIGSDDDSDEDEDYKGDDEEEREGSGTDDSESDVGENNEEAEESADKKTKNTEDSPESFDLFDGASAAGSVLKDSQKQEIDSITYKTKNAAQIATQFGSTAESKLHPVESLNLMLDEGFDSQPMSGVSQPSFPNSLSQWFGDRPSDEKSGGEVLSSSETSEFVNIGTFSEMDPFKGTGEEDMLMFCSGQFDTQSLARKGRSVLDGSTKVDVSVPDGSTELSVASDDEEEKVHKSSYAAHKRRRKVIESDEEDEAKIPSTSNEVNEENVQEYEFTVETNEESMSPSESKPVEPLTRLRRTIIGSDNDDTIEEEDEEPGTIQEEDVDDEEEEQDENDEEEDENDEAQMDQDDKPNDYIEKEADEYDSDDELAVIRRLQRSEFERKANREKWFDDEASLSGDDVGSDVDEDGDVANEYEAEEGDADEVPDSESIRRQNHRLLLKQEKDREHLELVRLQDRLLADGDLGGTETNRTFRLKLREDTLTTLGEDNEAETLEEEEDSFSQAHAQRVSAIKWLIEHEEQYKKICYDKEEEDLFDTAIRSVEILPETSTNGVPKVKAPRTLLGQSGLENAIKEVAGATFAKQLYVNNRSAAVKRPSSPVFEITKKMRSSCCRIIGFEAMLRLMLGCGRQITSKFAQGTTRAYAVGSKVVPTKVDKSAIEEDAEKLAKYVCINYFIQGEEPGPKILPDSEYPPWLFELDLRPPRPLEDLDPEKDGWLYWRALRIRQIKQNRRIEKLKTRFLHLQNSPSMKKYRRF